MGLRAHPRSRKRLLFSNYSPGEPPSPLVIPTGAKHSGGTCGLPIPWISAAGRHCPPLCYLDRSAAQWRDLCVDALPWESFRQSRLQRGVQ
jgi:hypothetical protein